MKLPIDVVPGSAPPVFVWSAVVEDMQGTRHVTTNRGSLPSTVESAVEQLIALTKQLQRENAALQHRVNNMSDRAPKVEPAQPAKRK